jgi:hypothetical protein
MTALRPSWVIGNVFRIPAAGGGRNGEDYVTSVEIAEPDRVCTECAWNTVYLRLHLKQDRKAK